MSAEFADTNVVLYLLDDGPKADRAEEILARRPRISVQVLNEALVNCRRKAGLSWAEAGTFLGGIEALCTVETLTGQTHRVGRALAERYQLSVYDAMICAAAVLAGCDTLWSEDMQDGLLIEDQLHIVNPFN
ncbi:PIN domain-containing protein [Palleronia caenipelagi]|uniref:Ribonuclease VapC n=1 Tax=Palleronia caenipelagi TaxID=2489174 RepID=A0A547PMJ0_9RHOB|nr:PIN domain-containing protein [Palleronia caenipelagi]TRD15372.1 PIN domain-containing protein [Palleronia caenipelagi]